MDQRYKRKQMSQAAIEFEDLHVDEEWRDIPSFPGYQASNMGRIKKLKSNKCTSGTKNRNGYMTSGIEIDNVRITKTVHKLVLYAFKGIPCDKKECDHINRNRADNRIENLRWVTRSENLYNTKNWGKYKKGVKLQKRKNIKKDGSIVYSTSYQARISVNGKQMNIGGFKTEEEAHQAYLRAYKNHFGHEWTE
jgi:hypothetical protein